MFITLPIRCTVFSVSMFSECSDVLTEDGDTDNETFESGQRNDDFRETIDGDSEVSDNELVELRQPKSEYSTSKQTRSLKEVQHAQELTDGCDAVLTKTDDANEYFVNERRVTVIEKKCDDNE